MVPVVRQEAAVEEVEAVVLNMQMTHVLFGKSVTYLLCRAPAVVLAEAEVRHLSSVQAVVPAEVEDPAVHRELEAAVDHRSQAADR